MFLSRFPDKKQFFDYANNYNVIPVCSKRLADMETPVSLLKKIYKKNKPVVLFESVQGGERWGRYSFLGTCAKTQIMIFKNHIDIIENAKIKKIIHNKNPFKVLRELMQKYKPLQLPQLPRFWGGLIGYFTYEMVCFFEEIANKLSDSKPIAHFIIPDEIIVFDNIQNTLTAIAIAFIDDNADKEDVYRITEDKLNQMLKTIDVPNSKPLKQKTKYSLIPKYSKEFYLNNVKKTKEYIYQGEIIQAVIAQPFECNNPPDLIDLYRAQRYINPSPYLYFMQLSSTALVGSSPETMVRLHDQIATLRPIAGTRPRGEREQEDRKLANDLLSDEKERAEHLMLVDLGRNDLGRVAQIGSVQVTDLMIVERYSHVMHLVSNIKCDLLPDKDAWDLLAATFPAGTLSGAPKIRAMQIIEELEKDPRGTYGGAVGYISFSGNMDLAITIRTACLEHNKLIVKAGAGIVADSDPEKEYTETINKAMSLEKALRFVSE